MKISQYTAVGLTLQVPRIRPKHVVRQLASAAVPLVFGDFGVEFALPLRHVAVASLVLVIWVSAKTFRILVARLAESKRMPIWRNQNWARHHKWGSLYMLPNHDEGSGGSAAPLLRRAVAPGPTRVLELTQWHYAGGKLPYRGYIGCSTPTRSPLMSASVTSSRNRTSPSMK